MRNDGRTRALPPGAEALLAHLAQVESEEERRRRLLVAATVAALALHALFAALFPWSGDSPLAPVPQRIVRVPLVDVRRIEPEPARPLPPEPPSETSPRRVPTPDRTPLAVEPIDRFEPPVPELVWTGDFGPIVLPTPPADVTPAGPLPVGGDVLAPVKLHAPHPAYPELARRARRQGVVILRLVVGRDGSIESIEPLTRLGLGLEAAAERAVRSWRFAPGTLRGEPVAVVYQLSVHFRLDG